ncbi:MAG: Arc-like DNA binding domain protein [Bacteriophage sp.]|nr:MAG: Arc-like DNA binding domain protein [Bacteriophage sp.]
MPKTDCLVIRITPELKAQLQAAAEADGRSASNYFERRCRH